MENKIGVITGKFAPLHTGHINTIIRASTQVDTLVVVLSFDQKFVDMQPQWLQRRLTLNKRLLWLKKTFEDMPHIHITFVDESNIQAYPEGAKDWAALVRDATNHVHIDKWFSSEPDYTVWINEHFPEAEHVLIDPERKLHNVSATMIRNNPTKYWGFMPSIVRREFLKKICFIGTESVGKSTLTRYLAKMYNTSWVEEYGRTFCEQDLMMDESLLEYDHYSHIAATRHQMEKEAERTANRILFCDTNAMVTQFYCNLYEHRSHPVVDALIDLEHYDAVIHLLDDVPWVDDGLRVNSNRRLTRAKFQSLIQNFGVDIGVFGEYHRVSGDYQKRLSKTIEIVQNLLGENNDQ